MARMVLLHVVVLAVCVSLVASEPSLADVLARLEKAEQNIVELRSQLNAQQALCSHNSDFLSANPWAGAGYINVANAPWNAVGDGVTDNINAIQGALYNASSLGGGIVYVPPGNYYISGTLVVPQSVTLKGAWVAPPATWGTGSSVQGTTLFAVSGADAFIFLDGNNAAIEGIAIYYPNQIVANPPIAYPYTIQGNGNDLSITNVLLVNSFQGVDFATYSCPRHSIHGLYGQTLYIGVVVDQCYDIGRIKQVHLWPFWSQDPSIEAYQSANTISFLFYRSDWEVVEDVFSWGHHVGLYFTSSSYGSTNGQFTDIDFDNVDVGIVFTFTQNYGVMISNLNLANAGSGASRVGIIGEPGGSAYAVVRGASFWGDFEQCVQWNSSGYFMLVDSLLQPASSSTSPAISLNAGRAMIRGNYFEDSIPSGIAVDIGPGTDRVMVVDNELVGNQIINQGSDTLVTDNHA